MNNTNKTLNIISELISKSAQNPKKPRLQTEDEYLSVILFVTKFCDLFIDFLKESVRDNELSEEGIKSISTELKNKLTNTSQFKKITKAFLQGYEAIVIDIVRDTIIDAELKEEERKYFDNYFNAKSGNSRWLKRMIHVVFSEAKLENGLPSKASEADIEEITKRMVENKETIINQIKEEIDQDMEKSAKKNKDIPQEENEEEQKDTSKEESSTEESKEENAENSEDDKSPRDMLGKPEDYKDLEKGEKDNFSEFKKKLNTYVDKNKKPPKIEEPIENSEEVPEESGAEENDKIDSSEEDIDGGEKAEDKSSEDEDDFDADELLDGLLDDEDESDEEKTEDSESSETPGEDTEEETPENEESSDEETDEDEVGKIEPSGDLASQVEEIKNVLVELKDVISGLKKPESNESIEEEVPEESNLEEPSTDDEANAEPSTEEENVDSESTPEESAENSENEDDFDLDGLLSDLDSDDESGTEEDASGEETPDALERNDDNQNSEQVAPTSEENAESLGEEPSEDNESAGEIDFEKEIGDLLGTGAEENSEAPEENVEDSESSDLEVPEDKDFLEDDSSEYSETPVTPEEEKTDEDLGYSEDGEESETEDSGKIDEDYVKKILFNDFLSEDTDLEQYQDNYNKEIDSSGKTKKREVEKARDIFDERMGSKIAQEKLWTKPEWETYKKQHPDTKIKPKFTKNNMDSGTDDVDENPQDSGESQSSGKLDTNKLQSALNHPKMQEGIVQIKNNLNKNKKMWPKIKENIKNWAQENPHKVESLKALGGAAVTTAILAGSATFFPTLIPITISNATSLISKTMGLISGKPKAAYIVFNNKSISKISNIDHAINEMCKKNSKVAYIIDENGEKISKFSSIENLIECYEVLKEIK